MRAWMRPAFYAFWVLFMAAGLLGAFASNDPLIRLACRIQVPTILSALILAPRLPSDLLKRIFVGVLLLAIPAFVLFIITSLSFGGGALNGRVEGSTCYLTNHGIETPATCRVYYTIAVLEMAVFVTWPVIFVLAFGNGSRGSASS
jgi:hypothetical protein